jgi:integrase
VGDRIGLRPEDYGTHSLRRTKASIIYKQTGNLRAVQILLGHTKIESTVRYLGVDVEDALALAERTEVLLDSSTSASKSHWPEAVQLSLLSGPTSEWS